MCRMVALKSTEPILLAHLITRPMHSMIKQSSDSRLRLDLGAINGDGFGIGWYDDASEQGDNPPPNSNIPCIYQAITPAWSNRNLHRLVEKIKSGLVFAHVRASTGGETSELNCHPWQYGSMLFMHNGHVAEFKQIKRKLQSHLDDDLFNFPQGSTDSEWVFALFLQELKAIYDIEAVRIPHQYLQSAMLNVIARLNKWSREANISQPSLLNFVISDGESIVATRYIQSRKDEAASLYFSTGTHFEECQESGKGVYKMIKSDKRENIVLIASEPLTFERSDWIEIPCQTLIVVTPKFNILQIPIKDEFFQYAVRTLRNEQYVESMGYMGSSLSRRLTDEDSAIKSINI